VKTPQAAVRLLAALALVLSPTPALADSVVLKNGNTFDGTIVAETDGAVVLKSSSGGLFQIQKREVESVRYESKPIVSEPEPPPALLEEPGEKSAEKSSAPGSADAENQNTNTGSSLSSPGGSSSTGESSSTGGNALPELDAELSDTSPTGEPDLTPPVVSREGLDLLNEISSVLLERQRQLALLGVLDESAANQQAQVAAGFLRQLQGLQAGGSGAEDSAEEMISTLRALESTLRAQVDVRAARNLPGGN